MSEPRDLFPSPAELRVRLVEHNEDARRLRKLLKLAEEQAAEARRRRDRDVARYNRTEGGS
jgi:hypothetical protein